MTYISWITEYIKEENSLVINVISSLPAWTASFAGRHHKSKELFLSSCKSTLRHPFSRPRSTRNSHARKLCKLGTLTLVVILIYAGPASEGQTWLASHEILSPVPTSGHLAEQSRSPLPAANIPTKMIPSGSLWSLEWGFIIVSSNGHVNPASDSRHFCAPTPAPVYLLILTESSPWSW